MPKLEPKVIQKELEQGVLWPVYWLYGQERMKSRELFKRIRGYEVDEANAVRVHSSNVRGFAHLPMTVEAA